MDEIIMNVFNGEKYLREEIESILEQTLNNNLNFFEKLWLF
tara:strand:+ start:15667 stop:15789 length:123 start_codon:yes stop_codon:yes gene_type:complete